MPKKVLMFANPIHPIPPLKGAAVESWIYEVSKRIISFEPHIISIGSPYYPKEEYREGIYFHRISFNPLYKRIFQKITRWDPLSYTHKALRIIENINPEIIHIHNISKWALQLIEKLNGKFKIILHLHNKVLIEKNIKIDVLVGCSKYILDLYKKNEKIKADYYTYLYNGIDLRKFRPYWENLQLRNNIRKIFRIKDKEFVILFVGRVSSEKGVEHFINTAMELKNVDNIKFFVIGEIPKKGERKKYLEEIFEKASLLKDKIFFTDFFPPSKMHLIFLMGDVLFTPSNSEGFGMVNIEAMATGIPVITREKDGIKEYLRDRINGFYVNEKNIARSASEILIRLKNDVNLRETIGRQGYESVKIFDWNNITLEVENLYNEII